MNWGTKIVLGMIAFTLFITAMVVYMFSVHDKDALVADDYYEKGINYNQEYNASQNTIKDHAEPIIKVTDKQLIIQLKTRSSYDLLLMRPSAAKDDIKDKGFTVSDSNLILIDKTDKHSGVWFLELNWESNGKSYYFKKNITL